MWATSLNQGALQIWGDFMSSMFPNAERVLASLAGLLLFTLNDIRMFQSLPRAPNPAEGQTHAVWLQLLGATEPAYLTTFDLALRWGLAGLTGALCIWALAETVKLRETKAE